MRIIFLFGFLWTGWACQATPVESNGSYNNSATELTPAEVNVLETQRQTFLAAPDLAARLERLAELEEQALALVVDEPLKLGSIGSAILDLYPGSQTGHFAMSKFYARVDVLDTQAEHQAQLTRLQTYMKGSGEGTADAPYQIMTINDAKAFSRTNGATPVGGLYQVPELTSFRLLLITRPQDTGLQSTHYDLSHVLQAFSATHSATGEPHQGENPSPAQAQNPWSLLRTLAANMDGAAQTAIGRYLLQMQKTEDAVNWLNAASRSGNVLANISLARIYLRQAQTTEDTTEQAELRELAMENQLQAIALGSTDAMYTLANLYLNDFYGEDNRSAAIPLLRRAANLKHAPSLLYLGYLHNVGRELPKDVALASAYYGQAAALNDAKSILTYGRFLTGTDDELPSGEQPTPIHQSLKKLAAEDESEAMVILGNLYARGITLDASNRNAMRWYKKAAKADPTNADIINEVAWTLSVSDIPGLKQPKYARRIMDTLMNNNDSARTKPEYLDTWAAAYAATGDFERAVQLQTEAIAIATADGRESVIDVLRKHLELFKAGDTVTEKAP